MPAMRSFDICLLTTCRPPPPHCSGMPMDGEYDGTGSGRTPNTAETPTGEPKQGGGVEGWVGRARLDFFNECGQYQGGIWGGVVRWAQHCVPHGYPFSSTSNLSGFEVSLTKVCCQLAGQVGPAGVVANLACRRRGASLQIRDGLRATLLRATGPDEMCLLSMRVLAGLLGPCLACRPANHSFLASPHAPQVTSSTSSKFDSLPFEAVLGDSVLSASSFTACDCSCL